MTLWSGPPRRRPIADDVAAFTESLSFDRALWRVDVAGSRAHVAGLRGRRAPRRRRGDAHCRAALDDGRRRARGRRRSRVAPTDEDVHTAIERRVTELAGPDGREAAHRAQPQRPGRAGPAALGARGDRRRVTVAVLSLASTLDAPRRRPPATPTCRATPTSSAPSRSCSRHHLRAHAWALLRDVDRLLRRRGPRRRLARSAPARSRARSLPIDPAVAADVLGFSATFANSLDAVADRDFVAELLFCLALLGVHLSRMGEELVAVDDAPSSASPRSTTAYATGSSMLPQKKNPDVAELARGKAGRLLGNLTGLLATLKGLPLAYNRDLQEDKEPLFDSVRQVLGALAAIEGCYATRTFDTDAHGEAADDPTAAAVDLAEWLVARGMPFREAHRRVGALVADAARRGHRRSPRWSSRTDGLGEEAARPARARASPSRGARRPGARGRSPAAAQRDRARRGARRGDGARLARAADCSTSWP